jgi:hypothetical protein
MRWLEIIEIRNVDMDQSLGEEQIIYLADQLNNEDNGCRVSFYKNGINKTDYSFHLQHNSAFDELYISPLAEKVISILKDFGPVNHSIWMAKL